MAVSGHSITVASYNMRKAIGTDRRRNPQRILQVLKEVHADVVALQEADKRFGGRASAVPHELIDSHGLYKPVPLGVRHKRPLEKARMHAERLLNVDTRNIGWHGNALLVKREIGILDCQTLKLPTLEPRGAVRVDLEIDGRRVRIAGMHLDLSGLRRRQQVRTILGHLADCDGQLPTVLMGDFNEWSRLGGCLHEFHHADWRVLAPGRSFPSRRPVAMLDRIVVSDGCVVQRCGAHHRALATVASDHLPVFARIGLPKI